MQPFAALTCIFYFKSQRQVNLSLAFEIKNAAYIRLHIICLAEREGFEPPEARTSTVFKTAAIDRSAISPAQRYDDFLLNGNSLETLHKALIFNG